MCQRLQGRSTRQIRRPLQIRPAAPSCTRSSTTIFCMSLRGAKRRGNPFSLRQHKAKRNYSRQIRRSCGFALSIANLLSFPAGLRIATPVCALVRNDMQKTEALLRLQGRFPAVPRQCPGIMRTRSKFLHVIARSEATGQSVTLGKNDAGLTPANSPPSRLPGRIPSHRPGTAGTA